MKLYDAELAPEPAPGAHLPRREGRGGGARDGRPAPERAARATPILRSIRAVRCPRSKLDDGEVICESAAICRYFEALHPEPTLFGATALDIGRIGSWTGRIESDGYAAAVYAFRNVHPAFEDRAAPGKWPSMRRFRNSARVA